MSATSDLRSEHGGVSRMLKIMGRMADRMADQMAAEQPPNTKDVDEVVEFLRVFVDKCHHGKEEQLLFPVVRASGLGRQTEDTIGELLEEHTQGREIVARIVAAKEILETGDTTDATDLIDAFTRFRDLLYEHIRREERDCFNAADASLPEEVQTRLQEDYDRLEREVIGEGRHEAFHAMLDRLETEYAAPVGAAGV